MELTNITPIEYRFSHGGCPAIYTACEIGASCPTVIAKGNTYVIIGAIVDHAIAGIEGKVGEDETAIEISRALVDEAVNAGLMKRIAELEEALGWFRTYIVACDPSNPDLGAMRVIDDVLPAEKPEDLVHNGEYSIPD